MSAKCQKIDEKWGQMAYLDMLNLFKTNLNYDCRILNCDLGYCKKMSKYLMEF